MLGEELIEIGEQQGMVLGEHDGSCLRIKNTNRETKKEYTEEIQKRYTALIDLISIAFFYICVSAKANTKKLKRDK